MIESCPDKESCVFGTKNEAQARAFIALVVKQTLEGVGLGGEDAKDNIVELRGLLYSWHMTKKIMHSGVWGFFRGLYTFFKWMAQWVAKLAAIGFFIWICSRVGLNTEKIKDLSSVVTGSPP